MAKRRPSGDGMVRKRSDGRWEGRIVVGHKRNGDPIFRYVYAPTQKELTAKLRQNIDAYQGVRLTEQSKITLEEWLDRWLTDYMAALLRPTTLAAHRRSMELHVIPYLGQKPLDRITAADLRKLYDRLRRSGRVSPRPGQPPGLSETTIRGIHATLHHALRTAWEEGLIPFDPAEQIAVPKAAPSQKNILTREQVDRLLQSVEADAVWYGFFYTELTTGLRLGEICGLMWSDFQAAEGILKVRRTLRKEPGIGLVAGDTKTYAGTREILLPPSTAQLLRERKKHSYSLWIFSDPLRPESPIPPSKAYTQLKTLLAAAGLPNIRFHDLRHTFATNALGHGMDVKTLSAILGHVSSATTLNTYTHVTDEMRRTAAAKIDQGITGREPPINAQVREAVPRTGFQPYTGKIRKQGTGCVTQLGENLWEGRYSPKVNGKRIARNIYAHSREECEEKLAAMIREMKAQLAPLRSGTSNPVCGI